MPETTEAAGVGNADALQQQVKALNDAKIESQFKSAQEAAETAAEKSAVDSVNRQ